ncbi:autotransporter domain-containing protein [Rhizobium sp. NFR03]|uniref:autotransporter outer membrane beta-barrel domain-containing protein n=1 Tax=Rhizobium sp. NFR03 TaxID=1566263 RepID=UPI0008C66C5F|nr:autotransporter domain-containing protein [Rhizobium sp. NFR03]SES26218.1 outer membrane autotransporter barrel domain-containing protein [Rhizobium sp. NFR03]
MGRQEQLRNRNRGLRSSTALTVTRRSLLLLPVSASLLAGPALALDDKDYIQDSGNVVWSTDQSFADDMIIGLENKGTTLTINSGANVLIANRGIIAGLGGSQATVTVSGPGSELNVVRTPYVLGNSLSIGGGCNGYSVMCITGGDGTLIVEGGGKVDAKNIYVGEGQGAQGKLLVTGAGSVVSANYLGMQGMLTTPSLVKVEQGGAILTNQASIGQFTTTTAEGGAIVTGAGSSWINSGRLDLSGNLTIENGGAMSTSIADLDDVGNLTVTGAGSSFTATNAISVETDSHVVVANGGNLNAANGINIGSDGYLVIGGQIDTDALQGLPRALDTQAAGTVSAGTVVNFGTSGSGRLVFNHTNTGYDFSNKIVGDGSIVSLSGETILSGDLTGFASLDSYAGGVIVDGNSRLVLKGDLGTALADDDTVSPNRTNFDVKNGTLVIGGQTGQVVTNFLGSETYTSAVDVWGDTLNGQRNVTGAYGKLAGFGTIGSTFIDRGATISPGDTGNPLGTITVRGDLDLAEGAIYDVDVAGNGASDRISVETVKQNAGYDAAGKPIAVDGLGRATIGKDSSVQVTALDAATSYQTGQTYKILTAQGGITGTFAQVVSKSAFLDVALDQTAKDVDLRISVKDPGNGQPNPEPPTTPPPTNPEPPTPPTNPEPPPTPPTNPEPPPTPPTNPEPPPTPPTNPEPPETGLFDSVADTRNQVAVARSLNTLEQSGESLALYNSLLLLSADEARGAFDRLSGEAHGSVKSGLITGASQTRDATNDRLRAASGDVAAKPVPVNNYWDNGRWTDDPMSAVTPKVVDPAWSVWGQAFGSWSNIDAGNGVAEADVSTGGLVTGIDTLVGPVSRLGVFLGYSRTSIDVDSRSSSADSDNYTIGLYGGTQLGALSLRSGLSYTNHQISTKRSVDFPGVSQDLKADYDAGSFQVYGELGYEIQTEFAAFEPFVNVAHVNLDTDGFREKGGSAALRGEGDTTNTTFTTLGLRASSDLTLGGLPTVASGTLGWRHAFGDTDPASRLAFAGSDSYAVRGAPVSQDAFIVQVGLDVNLSQTTTLGVSYNGEFGDDGMANGVDAKLRVRF